MATTTFSKEYLTEELGLPGRCKGGKIISDEVIDQRRWVTVYGIVFQVPGQAEGEAYRTSYEVGSTEYQGTRPWEDEKEVECAIVHRTTKTIEVWE